MNLDIIKNLKLNKLSEQNLKEKQQNMVKGGRICECGCGCHYQNSGGSSVEANAAANGRGGLSSSGYLSAHICDGVLYYDFHYGDF
jgi:natural product precursor